MSGCAVGVGRHACDNICKLGGGRLLAWALPLYTVLQSIPRLEELPPQRRTQLPWGMTWRRMEAVECRGMSSGLFTVCSRGKGLLVLDVEFGGRWLLIGNGRWAMRAAALKLEMRGSG